MIKLIYKIDSKEKDFEIEWLKDQRICPTYRDLYDWLKEGKCYTQFGMIVNEQQALAVKLRHPLQFQAEYRQR